MLKSFHQIIINQQTNQIFNNQIFINNKLNEEKRKTKIQKNYQDIKKTFDYFKDGFFK